MCAIDPGLGVRHSQTLMMFLALVVAYLLRVNLSLAIVAMTDKTHSNKDFPELPWDHSMKSIILSSFFLGNLVLQVPSGMLVEKWGAKWLLAFALGSCGVITVLTPLAAIEGGAIVVTITRIAQGLAQGFVFPALNVFMSKWAPPVERARLFSFAISGMQFGNMLAFPVAGLLAGSEWGWPSIFYVSGSIAILWTLVWSYVGANSPAEHSGISFEERSYIETSLVHTSSESSKMKVPWKAILSSGPVWAILIAHVAANWGYWTLVTEMPSYINSILEFNIRKNGFLSSAPFLAQWIVINVFSWMSDYITAHDLLSVGANRKMWNSVGLWGSGAALVGLALLGSNLASAISCLIISIAINAGIYNGFYSNHLALSPNFSGTLMGLTNGFANISSIMGPLFVGLVVTDSKSVYQWNIIFYVSAGVYFVGNLLFLIMGSSEIQPWNDIEYQRNRRNLDKEQPELQLKSIRL